ncbi:PREDICTED: protoheme IX farnesyltransferase, mitochondrial-like [Tarenaya hassleriana]|uniref:protoheme IX farnesyltransferase, mitochondrial-like n=1 Tax=Tarenaya hassleriana TaxID=28532 RepID=UPI00053C2BB2|nr:PREDICTED: protoheme IX farnesyltransferase, mitochondrial-like [Tarenaya hassleriana]
MWRRSAVSCFSSRISLSSSSPNPRLIPWSCAFRAVNSVSDPPLSSESAAKLAIPAETSDRVRAFASTTTAGEISSRVAATVGLGNHYARCYWELSKARLSMLVVATSGTGYILGTGDAAIDFAGLCYTCTGTMMVAASANSLNQIFEISNDAKMKRTRQRPLPSGRISVPHAVAWASFAGAAGASLLACKANILAAGLASSNLFLYAFVYTPLKQLHPINTWVGAVVGAIPPLLGWAAASGQISLNSMILPAALYFWQIPHFMALAYLCRNDYAAGGYKMFSLFDPSGQRTAAVALRNCLYMIPLGFLAYDWGLTSGWFCMESTVLTLAIAATAFSFYRDRTTQKARKMFHASLLFLPVFMSGLLLHRETGNNQHRLEEVGLTKLSAYETRDGEDKTRSQKKRKATQGQGRPPVAYASVAPFPFLPAPSFSSS